MNILHTCMMMGSSYDVERHFQQYFTDIIVVSLTCGGNRSTRKQLPTSRKSLNTLSHNVESRTPCHYRDFIDTDCIGSYTLNHRRITTTTTDYLTLSVYSIEIQDFNH